MRRIAAVILLLAASASGAELTITSGGRRVIDINPPGTTCRAWSYGAMPVAGDGGTIDTIYTAGDVLTNHCREGLTSPDRFGDHIWRHARNGDGTWSGAPVIARDALPWMTAPQTDSYVSHLASPAVVRSGGKWYMAFAASVSDPNLCSAEHGASTSCGSCVSPWSHFALLWAVSDDGITWRVRDGGGSSSNPALAAAVLWREPNVADTTSPPSAYKAIARVSMLLGTDNGKAYFYLLGMFWGRLGAKEILVRIPYDAAAPWGLGGDPEVVHYQHPSYVWEACPGGRMPEWLDDVNSYSIVNGFFNAFTSSVFATTRVPGYRYVALGVGHGTALAGYGGRNNLVAYQLSNDLMNWTSMRFVRSVVPFFGDGLGYTASIIDPIAVQDGSGTIHLYMASNDGDDARSIARDGAPDCATDPSFGATAAYVGVAIYEATLDLVEIAPTTITVAPPAPVVAAGPVRLTVHVTAVDGSIPQGVAYVYGDFPPISTALHDGVAEVVVLLIKTGSRQINAQFNSNGPWSTSYTSLLQPVVQPSHRRVVSH